MINLKILNILIKEDLVLYIKQLGLMDLLNHIHTMIIIGLDVVVLMLFLKVLINHQI
jgi:hypothetical protein